MAKVTYDKEITALLVIDPYNDFISEGGKLWDRLKAVAEANSCVPHMLQVREIHQCDWVRHPPKCRSRRGQDSRGRGDGASVR
jgi:hypothetical protein